MRTPVIVLQTVVLGLVVACGGGEDRQFAAGTGGSSGAAGAGGSATGGSGGTSGGTGGVAGTNTGGAAATGGAAGGGGSAGSGGATGGSGGATGGTGGATGGTGGATGGTGGTGGTGTPVCGNNKLESGEQCDDGNTNPSDGCSATCQVVCTDKNASAVPYTVNGRVHCYWRVGSSNSYTDTGLKCQQASGGHLATIHTSGENAFVLGLCPAGDPRCWIGLTDGQAKSSTTQATYGWVTGEPMSYLHWASGEPNWNGCGTGCYQHRGSIRTSDGFWDDRSQDDSYDGICEWDPKP